MVELLVPISFAFLALFGVGAALIPGLPAIFYMFIVSLVFGFVNGFVRLSSTELLILAGIYLVSFFVDMLSGVLGAKYGGASLRSLAIGICGAILGTIIFPPLGGFVGLFIGVLMSELQRRRTHREAVKAAAFGVLGVAVGLIINIILALIFFATFISFIFFVG